MSFKRILLCTAMVTAMSWCGVGAANAQTQNPERIVYFTFTQPVTIPGATLPAGRYRFQVLQSFSDRGILRIDSPDGSKHFGTLLAVPTTRVDPVAAPELRFLESASNVPPAIGSYWMPATGNGWEFVYPKDQATKLAINTKTPVLSGPAGNLAQQTSVNGLTRLSSSGQPAAYVASTTPTPVSGGVLRGSLDSDDNSVAEAAADDAANSASASAANRNAPAAANRNTSAAASSMVSNMAGNSSAARNSANANVAQNQQMSSSSAAPSSRTRLPSTAGNTPLAALAGMLALATAFGLGLWRRRAA